MFTYTSYPVCLRGIYESHHKKYVSYFTVLTRGSLLLKLNVGAHILTDFSTELFEVNDVSFETFVNDVT